MSSSEGEEIEEHDTDQEMDDSGSESDDNNSNDEEDNSNEEENSDSEENSNSDEERTQIRGELSTMSFEDLMQLKQKLGAKVYNEAIFGKSEDVKPKKKKVYKRVNSNRPMEMGSKRPVPFGISVISKKTEIRDPRFDPKCGNYESSKFKEHYDFVNEMRDRELQELKDKLKATNDPAEEKTLKFLIQRMDNQLKEEVKRKQKVEESKEEVKQKKLSKAEGKKPFFKKDSQKKAEDLVKQYLELKNSGKLEKHLEKRRKKIKTKDRKKFNFD